MKITLLVPLAAASVVIADYVCPANPSMTDTKAIGYGYTIQGLLEQYYDSIPVNASFFSDLPDANAMASNGKTLAENTVTNVEGLSTQAKLGAKALMEMGGMLGLTPPPCNYTFPMAPNGTAHLMNVFYFEATLCGAFIGLADYFQSPMLNSLSARLAAEHGIHASAIQAMMQPIGFMPNSTMLTPAFTPEMILQDGMEVGKLNTYLGGCVAAPVAPCGGEVSFGPLLSNLTGQSNVMSNSTSVPTMTSPTSSASDTHPTPTQYTGGANTLNAGVGMSAVAMVLAFLMSKMD